MSKDEFPKQMVVILHPELEIFRDISEKLDKVKSEKSLGIVLNNIIITQLLDGDTEIGSRVIGKISCFFLLKAFLRLP